MSSHDDLIASLERAKNDSDQARRTAAKIMNAVANGLKRVLGIPDGNIGFLSHDEDRGDTGERALFPEAGFSIKRDEEGVWGATMAIRVRAPEGRIVCDTYVPLRVQPTGKSYQLSVCDKDEIFKFDESPEKVVSEVIEKIKAVCWQRIEETFEWIRTGRSTQRRDIGFHVVQEHKS